jgi:hypothetical protein
MRTKMIMNYCVEPANATKGLFGTLQRVCNVFDIG